MWRPRRRCRVLPDEIMSDEIFARLPAKSVLACRCLSRAWAAALSSEDFIDLYRRLHGGRMKILRLHDEPRTTYYTDRHGCPEPPMDISGESFESCFVKVFMDDYSRVPMLVTTQCRGLVILVLFPMGFAYVCNPSTGQKRALPQGRNVDSEVLDSYVSLGLGYDVRARRHKVVRIYYRGFDGEGRPALAGCEVYMLGGGGGGGGGEEDTHQSSWRPVCAKPPGWMQPEKNSAFAQGHVYWLAHRKRDLYHGHYGSKDTFIASFSICEETFGTVPPPHGMDSETLRTQGLTELDGRLCLFSWAFPDHGQRYDVWLLSSTSTSTVVCWDLYCRIDLATASLEVSRFMGIPYDSYYPRIGPLALIDDDDDRRRILLAETDFPDKIGTYTPSTGDIVENILQPLPFESTPFQFGAYEESISTIGRHECKDITLTSSPSTQALSFVLRLLPERTLRRLMCVCRSWRTVIALDLSDGGPFLTLGR